MSSRPKTINEYLKLSNISKEGKLISPITETHCHLDLLKDVNLHDLRSSLEELGIRRIITIGTSNKNFEQVQNIQSNLKEVYFTLGTHPHEAKHFKDEDISYIKSIVKQKPGKMVAVGEIGLDYHYDFSPREVQIQVFKKHLELAIELELPVVIHTREADVDMMDILNTYAPKMKKKGVVHSFSSGLKLGKLAASLGFYLGFNGIITFKNAEEVREAVRQTPLNQILVETDSPFLAPDPFRGRQNEPTYIPVIVDKIAELKQVSVEDCLSIVETNATQCFFLD
tara:strand:- start:231 stop:1079 length:849 start_codon:yes stop_codon:yes gene_type:complete